MAIVSGPLMSMDASGAFGGTLVFTKWKGRPVVRQLVTPSNPQTADQVAARNAVRVAGAGQHFAYLSTEVRSGKTETDLDLIKSVTPGGQAWNGTLVKGMIGAGQVNYDAAETAYTALSAGEKTAWDTAAAGLDPAIPAVAQGATGGGSATPMVAGKVFFHYIYGLYVLGIASVPGATPPTYS